MESHYIIQGFLVWFFCFVLFCLGFKKIQTVKEKHNKKGVNKTNELLSSCNMNKDFSMYVNYTVGSSWWDDNSCSEIIPFCLTMSCLNLILLLGMGIWHNVLFFSMPQQNNDFSFRLGFWFLGTADMLRQVRNIGFLAVSHSVVW